MKNGVAIFLFGMVLLFVAVRSYRHPSYNFDLLPYMALAMASTEQDMVKIHSRVYEEVAREIPASTAREIVEGFWYRAQVAHNPYHFAQQLPFYSIRPAYVILLGLFNKAGLSYPRSAKLIAALSLVGIGLLIFAWMAADIGIPVSALLSSLLVVSPPFFQVGRQTTPDALSAFALLAAFYLIWKSRRELLGLAVLFLSLFIRTDNVLLVIPVAVYLCWKAQGSPRSRFVQGLVLAVSAISVVAVLNHFSGNYGWPVVFHHTLVSPIPNPAEVQVRLPAWEYATALYAVSGRLMQSFFPVFAFVGVIAFRLLEPKHPMRHLLLILAGSYAIRILLFPYLEDRFFVAGYSGVAVAASGVLASIKRGRNDAPKAF